VPIPLPSREEQAEIVRRVDEFLALADSIANQYQAALHRVEKLTPSVLAKAFRGELVPQDPRDEPAEKLLERVKRAREVTSALPEAGSRKSKAKSKKPQGRGRVS